MELIKAYRKKRNLTQKQMAKIINIHEQSYVAAESGFIRGKIGEDGLMHGIVVDKLREFFKKNIR